jgi:hypothetical protein
MAITERTVTMKKGDRLPSLTDTLVGPSGAVDLTGATVVFKFFPIVGGSVVSGSAVIEDATAGKVRYDWGASDTATAGSYYAEWVATIGGKEMTFPNGDGTEGPQYIKLVVVADVS